LKEARAPRTIELLLRRGYYRTLVAIANKNARIAWALLAKKRAVALGLNTSTSRDCKSMMMTRSDRRPENLTKIDGGKRRRMMSEDRACGLHRGQSDTLLTNRPVIVTQSDLPSSSQQPLQIRGSPYSKCRSVTPLMGGDRSEW
jgi:hypothetical protein